MAGKAGKVSDGVQIPHIGFASQDAHFMNLLKSHRSVNRTPVIRHKNKSPFLPIGLFRLIIQEEEARSDRKFELQFALVVQHDLAFLSGEKVGEMQSGSPLRPQGAHG